MRLSVDGMSCRLRNAGRTSGGESLRCCGDGGGEGRRMEKAGENAEEVRCKLEMFGASAEALFRIWRIVRSAFTS